jgi:hypothetical protein
MPPELGYRDKESDRLFNSLVGKDLRRHDAGAIQ